MLDECCFSYFHFYGSPVFWGISGDEGGRIGELLSFLEPGVPVGGIPNPKSEHHLGLCPSFIPQHLINHQFLFFLTSEYLPGLLISPISKV